MTVEYRKVVAYPPEVIPDAAPVDLSPGVNRVFEYTGISQRPPLILTLYGLSFARLDGARFTVDVDGVSDALRIDDLGAVRGLDYTEEVKLPAREVMVGRIHAPSPVSAYQMRHAVRVDRPTTLLKLLLNLPLTARDEELASKYNLWELVECQEIPPFDPYSGIQRIQTYTATLTSPGTILRLAVPEGQKAVLLDIAAERPASPGAATVRVERDRQGFSVCELDPYCLAGLENPLRFDRLHSVRIVCLEELLVDADVRSGTLKVRLVVGLGRLTLPEKVRWNLDLTAREREIAERLNLQERVEVGLA